MKKGMLPIERLIVIIIIIIVIVFLIFVIQKIDVVKEAFLKMLGE